MIDVIWLFTMVVSIYLCLQKVTLQTSPGDSLHPLQVNFPVLDAAASETLLNMVSQSQIQTTVNGVTVWHGLALNQVRRIG